MSQLLISGLGSITKLIQILGEKKSKNLLLVTGKKSYYSSGAEYALEPLFNKFNVIRFHDFELNPKFEDALRGAIIARRNNIDTVISIGGGSVIDISKLILAFIAPNQNQEDIVIGKDKPNDSKISHLSIPTTAGTGSESTNFAVVYLNNIKYSVSAHFLIPEIVILDGLLIKSNTPQQKACSGLDALAQAIESHWAKASNKESRSYSRKAIPILYRELPNIVSGSANNIQIQNFLLAANLAGKAINISKTTSPHAFSYPFSIKYGLPHGQAVWLTLPKIFDVHNKTLEKNKLNINNLSEYRNSLKELKILLDLSEFNLVKELQEFVYSLGIQFSMQNIGALTKEDRKEISEKVNLERMMNNPVNLTAKDINYIFDL
tara:strand:- start:847 stop:1977 length:1131 start_codon:yes stop_codon:yes gene_type:complete